MARVVLRLLLAAALIAVPVALATTHDKTGVQLRPTDLLATDLDRDKDVDIAVVGPCRGKPGTCLSGVENERKTLGTVRNVQLSGLSLAGASIASTGGGLVIAGNGGAGLDLAIMRSKVAGNYAITQRFDIRGGVADVDTGDVNGDGRIDIVVVGREGIGLLPGEAGGAFGRPVFTDTPFLPNGVVVERLDGDPFADIALIGGNNLLVAEGSRPGTISLGDVVKLPGIAIDLDAIRASAGTTPDLLIGTARGLQLFTTASDPAGGVEPSPSTFLAGPRPVGVVLTDVNRDNLVDIISLNAGSRNLSTNLASPGGGYGSPIRSVPIGVNPIELSAIDLNVDRRPDIVVVNADPSAGGGSLDLLFGDGAGGFRTGAAPAPPPSGSLPLDFNLTYNHPSPNQGFSWLCADLTSASGAFLTLTMTPPSGPPLQRKFTFTGRGTSRFKILALGEYKVRVDARAGDRKASKTKSIDVTAAQGSSTCGP